MTAWACLSQGFFIEKYKPQKEFASEEWTNFISQKKNEDMVRIYYSERNFERKKRLYTLAKIKKLRPIQLALAWVLSQPMKIYPVVGVRSTNELEELLKVKDFKLSTNEILWLNLELNEV